MYLYRCHPYARTVTACNKAKSARTNKRTIDQRVRTLWSSNSKSKQTSNTGHGEHVRGGPPPEVAQITCVTSSVRDGIIFSFGFRAEIRSIFFVWNHDDDTAEVKAVKAGTRFISLRAAYFSRQTRIRGPRVSRTRSPYVHTIVIFVFVTARLCITVVHNRRRYRRLCG